MSETNIEEQNIEFFKKQPAIFDAIIYGEEEKVKELIASGLDVNLKINEQISLLQIAIMYSSPSIVKILVDAGANINIICNDGMPLIHFATINNDIEILNTLIGAVADVNIEVSGAPLIGSAIMYDNPEIVEILIKAGADINVTVNNIPLIVFTVIINKEEMLKILLKSGLDINNKFGIANISHWVCGTDFNDPSIKRIFKNIINSLEILESELFSINNTFEKIKNNINEILNLRDKLKNKSQKDLWLKRKTYIDNKIIININNLNRIIKLLNKIKNNSIVYEAIDAVNMIKRNGADFDLIAETGETNLMLASYSGNIEVVELLLKFGADINHKSNNNETALSIAYEKNFNEIVKLLIEKGADVNIALENGKTLHDTAIFMKDLELENLIKSSPYFVLNTPQNLVKILKNFTIDKPMKYTTHIWDFGSLKNEYKDFKGYMLKVKEQWDKIKNDLEILSPNLYKKIFNFLWETDSNIALGWSSLEGLEEWCNTGNNPFEYKINDKTFAEIIYQFKNEIEIRKESDRLYYLFVSIQEQLDEKYEDLFTFNLKKLKGITFYTDIEKFKNGLNKIFDGIIQYAKDKDGNILYPEIQIETVENYGKYLDIYITHIGSYSNSTANNILLEVENGDFADIKENFNNLCDWSIQNSYENENYQVNYYLNEIEILEEKPQGFTHILRFYL